MQHGFDTLAETYDVRFTHSLIGSAQRDLVHGYLASVLPADGRPNILELACGTGEDAIWLARRGCSVTATDASSAMLGVAGARLAAAGLGSSVETRLLRAEEALAARDCGPYDLIFSNFGGLNCLSGAALALLAPDLRTLLKPGGRLIVVVMPRFCAWETLYFLLKGRLGSAFRRRTSGGVPADLEGSAVTTWYHSPASAANALAPAFRLSERRPVGFFIPPSYLEPFAAARPGFFRTLVALDRDVSGWQLLASAADHALLDFRVSA